MDVSIIYFSQTGNTKKVARAIASAFSDNSYTVQILSLKKAIDADPTQSPLIGVGAPCFSSQAPTPVKEFLRSLPSLQGRKAFVFATSGGAPGRVLFDMSKLLRCKGADVVGGFLARGELYHPAPCLIGRFPGRPDVEDLSAARHFADDVAQHVSAGRSGAIVDSRPDAVNPGKGFYDFVAFISQDRMIRMLLPEPKLDPDKCDGCGWCVYECPAQNIILDTNPVLGGYCIRCYRCLTGCPQQAFKVSWMFGNMAILSFYNTRFERWFGDIRPGEKFY